MEHTEAVQLKAAERYVLGELAGDLRAQYEDHYFGCAECAEDLRLAAIFVENTRAELESEPVRSAGAGAGCWSARRCFGRLVCGVAASELCVVPVFAILLLFAGYQNLIVIPHLKTTAPASAPQTLPSFSMITADSRGGEPLTISVPAEQAVQFVH